MVGPDFRTEIQCCGQRTERTLALALSSSNTKHDMDCNIPKTSYLLDLRPVFRSLVRHLAGFSSNATVSNAYISIDLCNPFKILANLPPVDTTAASSLFTINSYIHALFLKYESVSISRCC